MDPSPPRHFRKRRIGCGPSRRRNSWPDVMIWQDRAVRRGSASGMRESAPGPSRPASGFRERMGSTGTRFEKTDAVDPSPRGRGDPRVRGNASWSLRDPRKERDPGGAACSGWIRCAGGRVSGAAGWSRPEARRGEVGRRCEGTPRSQGREPSSARNPEAGARRARRRRFGRGGDGKGRRGDRCDRNGALGSGRCGCRNPDCADMGQVVYTYTRDLCSAYPRIRLSFRGRLERANRRATGRSRERGVELRGGPRVEMRHGQGGTSRGHRAARPVGTGSVDVGDRGGTSGSRSRDGRRRGRRPSRSRRRRADRVRKGAAIPPAGRRSSARVPLVRRRGGRCPRPGGRRITFRHWEGCAGKGKWVSGRSWIPSAGLPRGSGSTFSGEARKVSAAAAFDGESNPRGRDIQTSRAVRALHSGESRAVRRGTRRRRFRPGMGRRGNTRHGDPVARRHAHPPGSSGRRIGAARVRCDVSLEPGSVSRWGQR